jgi:ABC-type nitrate/sulfonate/bicarbonate transport system permease component
MSENMANIDQIVAVIFIAMIIGIVIAGAVMAHFSKRR